MLKREYVKIFIGRGRYIHESLGKIKKEAVCLNIIKNCGGATATKVRKVLEYKTKKRKEHRDVLSYINELWALHLVSVIPTARKDFAETNIKKKKIVIYNIKVYKITKKGRIFLNQIKNKFGDDFVN